MNTACLAAPSTAIGPGVPRFATCRTGRLGAHARWLGLAILWTVVPGVARAQDADDFDLRAVRAEAIRSAVAAVADSVVRVELIGVVESAGGEVAEDAPTVAVAVDDQRHFIASSMVVRGNPTSILLVTADDRRVVSEPVARDHARQLVLLRASEEIGVAPLSLSDVDPVVGQTVIAVGRHSGGLSPAVSTGILSAKARNWGLALQTDARVSSGFYGAPLIDLRGRVLGIIVPMVPEGGAEDETGWYDSGIAFAIPAGDIVDRLPTLIDGTDVHPGLMGIVARESDPYVESTVIAAVRPRSPAASAQLEAGDQVMAIDGVEVRSHRGIKQLLGSRDAGTSITVTIKRGDQQLEKTLRLTDEIPPLVPQQIGITVEFAMASGNIDTDPEDDEPTLVVSGVVPGSPADGELAVGDVITTIDGNPVEDVASLRRRIMIADPEESLRISIVRDEETIERELRSDAIGVLPADSLPESLRYSPAETETWETTDFDMPDLANAAAIVAPAERQRGEDDAAEGAAATRLGLVVLLADPGQMDLKEVLAPWVEPAKSAGVILCAIGPAEAQRWTPEEVDVPQRFAAALRQTYEIDSAMQVIAGADTGPGGSMAIASALLKPGTFSGLYVSPEVRPPGMRLRENDPAAPLQWWLPPLEGDDEAPAWASPLQKLGYPVLRGEAAPEAVLRWVRSLARI